MSFDIKKYCVCAYPLDEVGEKRVEYNYEGINVFLVSSARCIVHNQEKSYTVNNGEILYTVGSTIIEIVNEGHIIGVNINGIIPERFSRQIEGAFITSGLSAPFLPQQLMQIVTSYQTLSKAYLSNIAFEIINTLSSSDIKTNTVSSLVSDAVNLIRENYANVYGIEELAERLNVSKSHLVREFYKYAGITPGKYLINIRVDAVKQLLAQENLSLNTIAALTGFSGDNYLCKAFKKVTGETPMAYRSKITSQLHLGSLNTVEIDNEIYL